MGLYLLEVGGCETVVYEEHTHVDRTMLHSNAYKNSQSQTYYDVSACHSSGRACSSSSSPASLSPLVAVKRRTGCRRLDQRRRSKIPARESVQEMSVHINDNVTSMIFRYQDSVLERSNEQAVRRRWLPDGPDSCVLSVAACTIRHSLHGGGLMIATRHK